MASSKAWADLGERAVWTLVQAGIGYEVVALLNLPGIWGALAASAVSVIKSALATRWGNGTSATLPTGLERT